MRIFYVSLLLVVSLWNIPAWAQSGKDSLKVELDHLLTGLGVAPNDEIAARMESRAAQIRMKAGGPAAAMLLSRGTRNLQSGDATGAVQDFDAALALAPDFTEAFSRRAFARYEAGDVSGSFHDLAEAVSREPRDFIAWRTLSTIAETQGNLSGALWAWKKLLEVDPHTADAQKRLKELTRRVEGDES